MVVSEVYNLICLIPNTSQALEEQRAADAKLKAEQEKKVAEEKVSDGMRVFMTPCHSSECRSLLPFACIVQALSEKRAAEEGKRLALEQEAKVSTSFISLVSKLLNYLSDTFFVW
jgi:hypothetical protein